MSFIPKNNGASRRFAAAIVDNVITTVLTVPIGIVAGIVIALFNLQSLGESVVTLITYILTYGILIFYFGWFYKNKGGTPGKLLMKLQVINLESGGRIGYGRTFLREIVGKFLAAIILGIGFFMIIFRKDRRGLHDLIANTQVVYTGPEAEKGI
ncbi:MAG TPA: RDD family protein [Oligoflexia bacterium]|nr:RDD family protein [Oligoflexia bacterium]HMR24340.1 RDD family protein [Oligoflexia bacterium]